MVELTRAWELMATSSAFSVSDMGMSAMACSNCESPISVRLRSDTAARTAGVMVGLASMAELMFEVMPNSSTAPTAATPMAWPTLRMVVWMPPDCEASRSFTASATMLFVCELTMPAPAPATARPTHMSGVTTLPCSDRPMGMKASAMTQ